MKISNSTDCSSLRELQLVLNSKQQTMCCTFLHCFEAHCLFADLIEHDIDTDGLGEH